MTKFIENHSKLRSAVIHILEIAGKDLKVLLITMPTKIKEKAGNFTRTLASIKTSQLKGGK